MPLPVYIRECTVINHDCLQCDCKIILLFCISSTPYLKQCFWVCQHWRCILSQATWPLDSFYYNEMEVPRLHGIYTLYLFARAEVTNYYKLWPKTLETYSLLLLEARNTKSRCCQGHAPSAGFRGGSFFFLASGGCWQPLAWMRHSDLYLHCHMAFPISPAVSLCPDLFLFF